MKAFIINLVTVVACFFAACNIGVAYGYYVGRTYGMDYVMEISTNVSLWPIQLQIVLEVLDFIYKVGIVALPVTLIIGIICVIRQKSLAKA